MNARRTAVDCSIIGACALLVGLGMQRGLRAEDAEAPSPDARKPSSYAPADDLVYQLNEYVEQIGKSLANPENYVEYQQERVAQDANTLAVIALVLGMHDQENELKSAAPALIAAANELAAAAGDHQAATAALNEFKKSLHAKEDASSLQWEPVADLAQLMKVVPIVNNNLRRGVTGRRFDRATQSNSGLAATLAAIGQASMVDTNYCADESDVAVWAKISADMRDASAEVHKAVARGDQKTATAALERIVETCDACHHRFRD